MASHLFYIEIQNRVVKSTQRFGGKVRRIKGTQGNWYHDEFYFLAESEKEAEEMAIENVKSRRMLGIPINTKRRLHRQVEVLNARRIA
jgi:hypothetical protein